jgi:chemotaxis protein MotB
VKEQNIIIKKVRRKRGHEGGHGGSWKVAYGDFVTTMMAFFLLLWLLTMVAPEKRARLATYFTNFSLFEQSGSSFMEHSIGVMQDAGEEAFDIKREMDKGSTDLMEREELKNRLKREVETKLADVKDQIIIDLFEGGVRIQLIDKAGHSMFPLGSSEPTPQARKILKVFSENIKDLSNKIAIEGHTDSLSYSTNRYTNWELSTERASASRKELEQNGLNPDRLIRVAGYAATEPLIKDNPSDPRNRRISIMLFYDKDTVNPGMELGIQKQVMNDS